MTQPRLQRAARPGRVPGGRGRRVGRLVPEAGADDRGGHHHRRRAPRPLRQPRGASATAFLAFVNKVPFYGAAVLCLDQPNIQMLLPRDREAHHHLRPRVGRRSRGAPRCALAGMTSRFEVVHRGTRARRVHAADSRAPQRAQRARRDRASGSISRSRSPTIQRALAGFAGVQRRFQVRGTAGGVTVVDDYGHHPAEIRATLAAAKAGFDGRVVTVFQPHRYTRTQHLRQEFLTAFNQADVLVRDGHLRGGRGADSRASRAADLAEGIRAHGHRDVTYLGSDRARIVEHVVRDQPARATSCSRWAPATSASSDRSFCAGSRPSRRMGGPHARRDPGGSPLQGAPELPHVAAHRWRRRTSSWCRRTSTTSATRCMFAEREQLPVAVVGGGNNLLVQRPWRARRRPQARGLPRAAPSSTARRRWPAPA